MNGWLLDTNVLSELRKPKPSRRVVAFVEAQPLESLYISSVTIAEIRYGIELVADPIRRANLNEWLESTLRPMFEHRVLAITEDILLRWRLMVEAGRKAGHTFSQPDLFIAATAVHHALVIVTRDTREYVRAHVAVHDPWRDALPRKVVTKK